MGDYSYHFDHIGSMFDELIDRVQTLEGNKEELEAAIYALREQCDNIPKLQDDIADLTKAVHELRENNG